MRGPGVLMDVSVREHRVLTTRFTEEAKFTILTALLLFS